MRKAEQIYMTISANECREWTQERVIQAMEEYATEFSRYLLKNAMIKQGERLYLQLTDDEIQKIIENAIKEFENGNNTQSTV